MPYVKIEGSGCCERKGMVQVRFCMYLDASDYGYDRHHIQVPDFSKDTYKGKVDKNGIPVAEEYQKWVNKLPKVWQNNPFHNHFIYVEPDSTDKEILDIAEAFLHEAYIKWASDTKLDLVNTALPVAKPAAVADCEAKVKHLKETVLERKWQ